MPMIAPDPTVIERAIEAPATSGGRTRRNGFHRHAGSSAIPVNMIRERALHSLAPETHENRPNHAHRIALLD